jgi:hypothetical protein
MFGQLEHVVWISRRFVRLTRHPGTHRHIRVSTRDVGTAHQVQAKHIWPEEHRNKFFYSYNANIFLFSGEFQHTREQQALRTYTAALPIISFTR